MAEGLDTSIYPPMGPELVAPLVAWMCHEQCSVSGEMLSAMAGRLSRMYLAETPGVYRPSWTIADVDAQMNAIRDTTVKDQWRSEEHTSELQSLMRISYAVFCLKKKNTKHNTIKQI